METNGKGLRPTTDLQRLTRFRSINGFHLIRLIVHTTSLYLIIVLLLLLYTPVFLRVQFLALCFSPYIISLSLPLFVRTLTHNSFDDDIQLQMTATPDKTSEYLNSIQLCKCDVKAWATANMLKLRNNTRTNLQITRHLHVLPTSITIGNAQFPFKHSVKNFGLTLDCRLTMNAYVSTIACHPTLNYVVWHLFVVSS